MLLPIRISVKSFILALVLLVPFYSFCQAQETKKNPTLEKAIGQFKHENYDEALITLQQARKEDPKSTIVAYYLGLTYKKLQRYSEAVPALRDAVTFEPKIKGALMELIDSLYQLNELEEAHKWIAEAENEQVRPAQTAFLKGLVLVKQDKIDEAVAAFNTAKSLEPSMAQGCDYQIGIAYLKTKKYNEAKNIFKGIVTVSPTASISVLARQYVTALERREEVTKPFHLNAGLAWQYDDNVTIKPDDSLITSSISGKSDSRQVYTMTADYNHTFSDLFSVRALYGLYFADQNHLNFYDMFSNNLIVQPTFTFKNSFLSFPMGYNHVIVDYRSYLSSPSISSVYNFMVGSENMGQASFAYQNKNYFWAPSTDEEGRNGYSYGPGFAWYRFFAQNKGFLNARYGLNQENTVGNNWTYMGNRFTLMALIPVLEKLNLTISGDAYLQRFSNTHSVYFVKRKDNVYTFSAQAAYKFWKDHEIQFQYTRVKDDCNIRVYEYKRNIYSVGVNFKF